MNAKAKSDRHKNVYNVFGEPTIIVNIVEECMKTEKEVDRCKNRQRK